MVDPTGRPTNSAELSLQDSSMNSRSDDPLNSSTQQFVNSAEMVTSEMREHLIDGRFIHTSRSSALPDLQRGITIPVQESQAEGSAGLVDFTVNNFQPSQAQHQRPDVRMVLNDTIGMRVEHPSDAYNSQSVSMNRTRNGPVEADEARRGDTEHHSNSPLQSHSLITHPTFPDDQKVDLLFHITKNLNDTCNELKKKACSLEKNNLHLMQELQHKQALDQSHLKVISILKKESLEKDNMIQQLQTELKQLKGSVQDSNRNGSVSLRPAIKCRFQICSQYTRECINCKKSFTSEEEAKDVTCSYHRKAPIGVSAQMLEKVCGAGGAGSKQMFWACCQQVGTMHKAPPACCQGNHGSHCLRIISQTSLTCG